MTEPRVIQKAQEPTALAEILATRPVLAEDPYPQYGSFGRQYYPEALAGGFKEGSFLILDQRGGAAFVECVLSGEILDHYGFPIKIKIDCGDNPNAGHGLLTAALRQLNANARDLGATALRILDHFENGGFGGLGRSLLAAGAVPRVTPQAFADLTRPDEEIWRGVRKRYRSHINRGKRELHLQYVNWDNPDRTLFQKYQAFHQEIAGRVTRPEGSWAIMFETIVKGHGELSMAFSEDGALRNGTLIIDGAAVAQYASGVNDRAHFDHPLGHWPMFNALMRARDRGCKAFDLGAVPPAGTTTDKEVAIGEFKRGFTAQLDATLDWHLPVRQTTQRVAA